MSSRERVTAQTYRTATGEIIHEYLIDGVAYSDAEQVEAILRSR